MFSSISSFFVGHLGVFFTWVWLLATILTVIGWLGYVRAGRSMVERAGAVAFVATIWFFTMSTLVVRGADYSIQTSCDQQERVEKYLHKQVSVSRESAQQFSYDVAHIREDVAAMRETLRKPTTRPSK